MASGLNDPLASAQHWLTQGFHAGHLANDIACVNNSILRAPESGRVFAASWNGDGWAIGGGYAVIIDHGPRLRTVVAHNARLIVAKSQIVLRGQIVGYTDSTGNSTGPHAHYAVRRDGTWVDPRRCHRVGTTYPGATGNLAGDSALFASVWLNGSAAAPLRIRTGPSTASAVAGTVTSRYLVWWKRNVNGQDPYGDGRNDWAVINWGGYDRYVWAPRVTRA